jgi:hypothetical protein
MSKSPVPPNVTSGLRSTHPQPPPPTPAPPEEGRGLLSVANRGMTLRNFLLR